MAGATREAEERLLQARTRNELLARVKAECEMWKERAMRAEERPDKEQTAQ